MILFVEFQPGEASAAAGFAEALGQSFDVLSIPALTTGPSNAGKSESLGLSEIPSADAITDFLKAKTGYDVIAAVSSMASKDVLARLAGALDAPMVTDAIGFQAPNRFKRPVAAGNAIQIVEALAPPVIVTFRPSGFPGNQELNGPVTQTQFTGQSNVRRLSSSDGKGGRPDLAQAKVVVSGGRPLKDAAAFESIIGGLADALGGAVGATRAAVDSGIAPNELQVGQTGKVVAPNLYIAAGISGSTQHLAGIKDSKIIVAINTDPDAPIFEAADFGLVADLFLAVPELTEKVRR